MMMKYRRVFKYQFSMYNTRQAILNKFKYRSVMNVNIQHRIPEKKTNYVYWMLSTSQHHNVSLLKHFNQFKFQFINRFLQSCDLYTFR